MLSGIISGNCWQWNELPFGETMELSIQLMKFHFEFDIKNAPPISHQQKLIADGFLFYREHRGKITET
jgi:hypothetical protein